VHEESLTTRNAKQNHFQFLKPEILTLETFGLKKLQTAPQPFNPPSLLHLK